MKSGACYNGFRRVQIDLSVPALLIPVRWSYNLKHKEWGLKLYLRCLNSFLYYLDRIIGQSRVSYNLGLYDIGACRNDPNREKSVMGLVYVTNLTSNQITKFMEKNYY
jgi:hypothetical protein